MSQLRIESVEKLNQAMQMRGLRNRCREFMTHDQRVISEQSQLGWFEYVYVPKHRNEEMFGYLGHIATHDHTPIAFGFIAKKDDKYWLTGGVTELLRGDGYGRQMFEFLTETAHTMSDEVWLDVFEDNLPARRLYESLGYLSVAREDNLVLMVHFDE